MRAIGLTVAGIVAGTVIAAGALAQDAQAPAGKGARHGAGGRGPRIDPKARFEEIDQNKDGKVTIEEFKAFQEKRIEEMFKRLDADGDGALMPADLERLGGPGKGAGPGGAGAGEGRGKQGLGGRGLRDRHEKPARDAAAAPAQGERF